MTQRNAATPEKSLRVMAAVPGKQVVAWKLT
jgi:hypothetical protein